MCRNGYRLLAGQAIGNQQNFFRRGRRFDRGHFAHQGFIDIGPPCGIEHHHIKAAQLAGLYGAFGNIDRRLPVDDGQGFNFNLLTQNFQLLHRGGALGIQRGHQDFAFFLAFFWRGARADEFS